MAGARNKKKIPTYIAEEFEERITKKQVKDLQNRMNNIDKDPKNLAREIIHELPKLVFKNDKQKDFYNILIDKEVAVCQGVAGTGKTYIAIHSALNLLLNPKTKINRIYLTKPCQQLASENLGFIKGGIDEKIAPIMESFDGVFEDLIGEYAFKKLVEEKIVVHLPMAFLRGRTLSNAVILFDEVQMSTTHSCRTLLQRLGENSRIFLLGDKAQTENKNRKYNPLSFLFEKFQPYPQFGVFEFFKEDIVRNPLISIFETIFEDAEMEAEQNKANRSKLK